MKAIQVLSANDVKWVELPTPEIQNPGEVRVRIKAGGICGTDVGIARGTNVFATYPRVIGHEIAGEVESVGSAVTNLVVGDKVVLEPISYCGKCYACRKNRPNVCQHLEVYGIHRDGGFCEYLVAPEEKFHKVPNNFSFEQAALMEPFTIGAQCTWRAGVEPGDMVLITGAGPMGLIAADTCKSLGAEVIISEPNEYRRNMSKLFGADYRINPETEDLKTRVEEITQGMGPNVVIEASGLPSLVSQAIELVSVAGRVVPLGYGAEPVSYSSAMLTKKEASIFGSRLQTNKFAPVIERLAKDLTRVEALITPYPAQQFMQAFSDFKNPEAKICKAVLVF
ncbi:MAG: zinc-binding alcohol dehydrogenase family protein [Defluviitaleaceae bacterium]|nr:zinc-binding alcohol dehydrogenase family protein [Defluviitaleaceae bacterium]